MDLRIKHVKVVIPSERPGYVGLDEEDRVGVLEGVCGGLGEDEGRSGGGAVGFGGGAGFAVGFGSARGYEGKGKRMRGRDCRQAYGRDVGAREGR